MVQTLLPPPAKHKKTLSSQNYLGLPFCKFFAFFQVPLVEGVGWGCLPCVIMLNTLTFKSSVLFGTQTLLDKPLRVLQLPTHLSNLTTSRE